MTLEQGPLRVVVTDAGDEPKSLLRYHPTGTEAHARVRLRSAELSYDITLAPSRADGSSWLVDLGVKSGPDGDPCCAPTAVWDEAQPLTHCVQMRLDARGRVQALLLSPACEQRDQRRSRMPFVFTIPWPDEPVGVGAEWTVSTTIGLNRRSFADTQYKLLARRGGELLVAFSMAQPGTAVKPCSACTPTEVIRVDGIGRVDLTRWVPLAEVVYDEIPRPPKPSEPATYKEGVYPDWAAGAEDSLLDGVLSRLESQRINVKWATVHAVDLFTETRDVEPLLNARRHADPRLRRAIEDILARVTHSDERGLVDWWYAALDCYCTGKSATHAIELLDEGLALAGSRRELRARALAERGILRRAAGDLAGAAADFTRALQLDPKGGVPILSTAWWLATAPVREQRNAARALVLLKRLDADPEFQSCGSCRSMGDQTWAAVLAELGRFEEAGARQREAKEWNKSWYPPSWEPSVRAAVVDVMTARENAYRKRQPWRDNWIAIEQDACRWYRYPVAARP